MQYTAGRLDRIDRIVMPYRAAVRFDLHAKKKGPVFPPTPNS
jgi:hypothetical protein